MTETAIFEVGDIVEVVGPFAPKWRGWVADFNKLIGRVGKITHITDHATFVDFGKGEWGLPASNLRHARDGMDMNTYQQRDIEALGGHYQHHIAAMTKEGLYRKSDIAAELAHRDWVIAELTAARHKLASNALMAMEGAGIPTPERGFVTEPDKLKVCIKALVADRLFARTEYQNLSSQYEAMQARAEILTRERDEAYEALHSASEAYMAKDDAKLLAMLCHRGARANAAGEYQTQRARAENAEAILQQWRKAYTRNILTKEGDDETAHLHAAACADQYIKQHVTSIIDKAVELAFMLDAIRSDLAAVIAPKEDGTVIGTVNIQQVMKSIPTVGEPAMVFDLDELGKQIPEDNEEKEVTE